MKDKIRSGIFLLTAAVLLASTLFLSSCSKNKESVAMEYRSSDGKVTSTISESFVSLWIAVQKNASSEYLAYVDAADDGWNLVLDEKSGATFSEVFRDDCVRSLKNLLSVEYIHDHVCKIEFTEEQQKSVESKMNEIASSLGSEKNFEQEMQKYGSKTEDYEKYMTLMLKQSTLLNYFYGENGERAISEDEKKEYFESNYVIVKHIFFDMRGITKDDGTKVSLTADEKEQVKNYAEDICEKIKDGTLSFDEAFSEYNEDAYAASHPNGYFVAKDGTYFTEFTEAAFSLLTDDVACVQTSAGMHIIKRYPMNGELYDYDEEVYSSISENLLSADFSGLISTVSDGVKTFDETIEKLDAALITPFSGF